MAHALVIDDDAGNLAVLSELLNLAGVGYTTVQDPRRLPDILGTLTQVDVVFLDLELPHADGYQIFEFLKGEGGLADVPIVACTVHLNEINTVRQMGFHSFLPKPLDDDGFADDLAKILRGERVWKML